MLAVPYRITVGNWRSARRDAIAVRADVFVREQGVPRELELDARDADGIHALAYAGVRAIGTGRLLPDAHIGRMAVRKPYRRRGVGSLLLEALVAEARQRGDGEVVLAAQLHAVPFYRRHGFIAEGAVFLDAGIEHIAMRRRMRVC